MIEISQITDEKEILEKAVKTYGFLSQQDMMIEEMSELTKALLKLRRKWGADVLPEKEVGDVLEEMADVQIMLDQMYIIFGKPDKQREYKINRLKERLEHG